MKKLSLYIFLGLLWCNVGFAEILLKNCKRVYVAGAFDSNPNNEVLGKLAEGAKNEYYISYKDGFVYHTRVRDKVSISVLEKNQEIGLPTPAPSKTFNSKYIINFADETEIIAVERQGDDPEYSWFDEISINLKKNEIVMRSYAETIGGRQVVELIKEQNKKWGYPIVFRCEKEHQSDSDGASGTSGTAFFISKKGYLLTNNHVVEGCKLSKINYFNKEYDAELIATDKTLDLALLKVEAKPKSYISFSKDKLKKRQLIIIAGYPLGEFLSDDLKINEGKISSLKGFDNNSNEITVDIAINPGNSGGPIVNEKGQLVAVAVAGMSKEVTEGISFGIKYSAAANFLKSNKINPNIELMSFSMDDDKLNNLLEESTVYTFCN